LRIAGKPIFRLADGAAIKQDARYVMHWRKLTRAVV